MQRTYEDATRLTAAGLLLTLILLVGSLCSLQHPVWSAPAKGHVVTNVGPAVGTLRSPHETFIADDFCLEVWRNDRMPLKVYLQPGEDVPGYNPKFQQSFRDACTKLSTALGYKVTFQFIDTKDGADIDVRWTTDKDGDFCDKRWSDRIGLCSRLVSEEEGTVDHASISLLTTSRYEAGCRFGPKYMQETCLHELGHACGLGHSLRSNDIMYKSHAPARIDANGELELTAEPHLSERDVASLKLLITAQNEIIRVKESCDRQTACERFNNEAFRLISVGDNGQALIYLRSALERDEKNVRALQNAMVALFNCACELNNSRHWAEALPILEKATKVAKKVGTPQELARIAAVQRNCNNQLAWERKNPRP
jgi:hypothetical protein